MIFIQTNSTSIKSLLEILLTPNNEGASVPFYDGEFFLPESYFSGFNKNLILKKFMKYLKLFGHANFFEGKNKVLEIFWEDVEPNWKLKKLLDFYSL